MSSFRPSYHHTRSLRVLDFRRLNLPLSANLRLAFSRSKGFSTCLAGHVMRLWGSSIGRIVLVHPNLFSPFSTMEEMDFSRAREELLRREGQAHGAIREMLRKFEAEKQAAAQPGTENEADNSVTVTEDSP